VVRGPVDHGHLPGTQRALLLAPVLRGFRGPHAASSWRNVRTHVAVNARCPQILCGCRTRTSQRDCARTAVSPQALREIARCNCELPQLSFGQVHAGRGGAGFGRIFALDGCPLSAASASASASTAKRAAATESTAAVLERSLDRDDWYSVVIHLSRGRRAVRTRPA
jgi:hypothetical protein